MSMIWKEVPLGEIIENFDSKRIPLSTKERSIRKGDYPYYGASGVIDYIDDYIFDGSYLLISEDGENLNTRKTPIAFWAHGKFWVNNHAHIVKGIEGKANTNYIRYWFSQADISGYITGAAQPKLSQGNLNRILINLPALEEQERIVGLLSKYDDLIENNNRRIQILETIAQKLYQEWFVHYRFPNHEQAQWQETEQGKIPVGWEVKAIADEIEILGGGTPSKAKPEYWDEENANINWFTPSDLTKAGSMFVKNSSLKITDLGLKKSSAKIFPAYSVMMTSRATIGVISINAEPATTNQGFIICVPSERVSTEYIYYWLKANMKAIDNLATGATFKEVRRTLFKELPFIVPSESVMQVFNRSVKPVTKMIEVLISKNENLKQQRDLLLPKLISNT